MTWGNLISASVRLVVFTPLILVRYSANDIAFWYMLMTINSFATVLDFGFYPTFSRLVSYAFNGLTSISDVSVNKPNHTSSTNWHLMSRIYGTTGAIYSILGVFIFIILIIFTYDPINHVISQSRTGTKMLWIAYFVFVSGEFFNFFTKKYDAILIGTNHVALINRWNIIINTFNALISILIVYLGGDVLALSTNHLLFSIILCLRSKYLEAIICERKFSKMTFFDFDKEIFIWGWTPIWKSAILILCSTGITQASGIIYAKIGNTSELAAYLLTLKLVSTLAQFSQAPFYSKLPIFSGLRVKHQLESLIKLSANSIRLSLLVFVLGAFLLLFFGDYCLYIIGSNAQLIKTEIIMLMLFVWFLERHHAMHAQIYVTTNDVPFYKSAIITAIFYIVIAYYLLPHLGVLAFPIAHGLSNLLINNWWNVKLSISSLETSFITFFKKSALLPFSILIFLILIKTLLKYV
ncbi:hypothetical protein EMA8858_02879 [Emticicia aquatica]|uniref:Polysaccharide biosynthesis protein n=1 Tax=Emticicia aquatica TaxID=1681835 RepID=A0ABM9ATA8_9BACT|nr:hypothetical protein [Emticicia aquatica]CAH0996744.1 hypothetical protein EMA8858_02879 [Emticicia aquatica]